MWRRKWPDRIYDPPTAPIFTNGKNLVICRDFLSRDKGTTIRPKGGLSICGRIETTVARLTNQRTGWTFDLPNRDEFELHRRCYRSNQQKTKRSVRQSRANYGLIPAEKLSRSMRFLGGNGTFWRLDIRGSMFQQVPTRDSAIISHRDLRNLPQNFRVSARRRAFLFPATERTIHFSRLTRNTRSCYWNNYTLFKDHRLLEERDARERLFLENVLILKEERQ